MEVAVGVVRTAEDYERIVPVRLNLKVNPHLTTYSNLVSQSVCELESNVLDGAPVPRS